MKLSTSLTLLLAVLPVTASFAPVSQSSRSPLQQQHEHSRVTLASVTESSQSSLAQQPDEDGNDNKWLWNEWANENGITVNSKISVRPPLTEERGKGGVEAVESIGALEVLARIPRNLIVAATSDMPAKAVKAAAEATSFSWATDLTAATLVAMHPSNADDDNVAAAKQSWVTDGWKAGGWATDPADLGPPDAGFGPQYVTGSLMATGSDNDHNIYAKFRFPCHPVVHRAAIGLALLTESEEEDAREALTCRGRTYRFMRDALLPLVETPTDRKGSLRERRAWDVSDALSRVLSRATTLSLDDEGQPTVCIVPLHDRLAHCSTENSKLVCSSDDAILLVATRDIAEGEAITRNYVAAPQLEDDKSEGAMRLLLQFGLPPKAWTA